MTTGWASITLGGKTFELQNLRLIEDPKPKQASAVPLGVIEGQYKATFPALISEEARERFLAMLPCIKAPQYRERAGILETSTGQPVSVEHPQVHIKQGQLWQQLGTTLGNYPADNRLRKFVVKNGRLIEKRARGRTGFRSLQEAVEDALRDVDDFLVSRLTVSVESVRQ